MTTLREAAQQALEALDMETSGNADERSVWAMLALRAALKQPEQEPMAWMQKDGEHISLTQDEWHCIPLYTHPPRREWRGLTEDETMHFMNDTAGNYWADEAHIQRFRSAIEAALKERNA